MLALILDYLLLVENNLQTFQVEGGGGVAGSWQ